MNRETHFQVATDPAGVKYIPLENCDVRLLQPGIVETLVKEGACIDVNDVLQIKKANMFLNDGNKYAVLVTSGNFNSITEGARKISASKEFIQQTIGKALLVHNEATRLVASFYLRINKPEMPTRLFTNREKALQWLKKICTEAQS